MIVQLLRKVKLIGLDSINVIIKDTRDPPETITINALMHNVPKWSDTL